MRTLAAAVLIACLAAACSRGGDGGAPPPAPTPEATSTPTPEATSTPAPEAASTPVPTAGVLERALTLRAASAATPEARSGLDLLESAPDAFTHRTFGAGEAIDWTHGVYVFDVETGLTEGYAVAGAEGDVFYLPGARERGDYLNLYYPAHRGGWIESLDEAREWRLLLDRETGRSWRWPIPALRLAASSEHGLLFEDRDADRNPTGRFTLANRGMEEIARFSVAADDDWPYPDVSPDGRAVAFVRRVRSTSSR